MIAERRRLGGGFFVFVWQRGPGHRATKSRPIQRGHRIWRCETNRFTSAVVVMTEGGIFCARSDAQEINRLRLVLGDRVPNQAPSPKPITNSLDE